MTSSTRLHLSLAMILVSVAYGAIVVQNPAVATAITTGYIAFVLTALLISQFWKRP